jgi:hypothetical protein
MSKLFSHFNFINLSTALVAFLLFVLSYDLNSQFDQYLLFTQGISLLFIPAGIKLLAILVGRVPAIIGLYLASVYLSIGLWSSLDIFSYYYFATISLLSYSAAVFLVLKGFGISTTLINLKYSHIVFMSLLACLINGTLHNLAYLMQGVAEFTALFANSAAMSLGDFLGCFVVVACFHATLQFVRYSNNSKS